MDRSRIWAVKCHGVLKLVRRREWGLSEGGIAGILEWSAGIEL